MTTIIPFRGITYNPTVIPIAKVLAPPLETLTPERLPEFREQHSKNITRMVYPENDASGAESARLYRTWTAEKSFVREKNPVIYVVEQVFATADEKQCRRRGFIALWKFAEQSVTMDPLLTQRLAWTIETGLWPAPLCALYNDPTRRIDRYLSYALRSVPAIDGTIDGVRTSVWKLNEGGAIAGIVRELKEKSVCVAGDGTDISLANALRTPSSLQTEPGVYDFVPVFFTNVAEPDFVDVPMHRVVTIHREFSAETVRSSLEQAFTLTEIEDTNDWVLQLKGHGIRAIVIGFSGEQKKYLAVLKESVQDSDSDSGVPVRYAPAVFDGVVQTLFGENAGGEKTYEVRYYDDMEKVKSSLESDRTRIACFVNPVPSETVISALSTGLPVPKAVFDVYPRLPLGIVLHSFHE